MRLFTNEHLEFASTGATEIWLLLISLTTGLLSARWLGPEGRGTLAIIILWPSLIAAFGSLGIYEALVFYQAGGEKRSAELTGAAFLVAILQSFMLISIGWFLIPLLTTAHGPVATQLCRQYLIFIPLNLLSLYPLGLLRGQKKIHLYNLIRGSVNVFYLLGMVMLWITDSVGVWTMALSLLFANAVIAAWAWWVLLSDGGLKFSTGPRLYRDLFLYGVKNHLGTISLLLNARLDQMLMALFLAPVQLGWYVIAVSVAGISKTASAAFEKLLFPNVAAATTSEQKMQIISIYSRRNFTATFWIVLGLLILAPIVIPIVYSKAYIPAILPAEILIIAGIFLSLNQNWEAGLRGLKRPDLASMAEFVGLLVTALGLWLFLPRFHILGAAIASLMAYASTSIYLYSCYYFVYALTLSDLVMPLPFFRSVKQYIQRVKNDAIW